MRKLSTLFALVAMGLYGWAQPYNVTFRVDMNQQIAVSPNGVHVAGNFQAAAGYPGDWNPSTTELTDANNDGIYELTVQLPAGSYQYKYINGNAWGSDELIPSACQVGGNRGVTVSGDTVLTAFCYGLCGPCAVVTTYPVTFRVDMNSSTVNANGVHVAGDFQAAAGYPGNWNPGTTQLSDANSDGIYEVTLNLPAGSYQYKYINGNAWGQDESVPSACSTFNNRTFTVSGATTLDAYCFGTCNILCTAPTYFVQFRVDMNNECNWDSVDVAGSFNNWAGSKKLTPSSPSGVYARTLTLAAGGYDFKFRKWYNGSVTWESFSGNRTITVSGHTSTPITCFNSMTSCGTTVAPADVTFKVNMAGVTIDTAGVYLIGDFTTPSWQGGAIQLTQSGSNPDVYETTVSQICLSELRFKFVNGDPTIAANEEQLDAADSACAEANGLGGYNRYLMRSGSNETVSATWESCGSCDDLVATATIVGNYAVRFRWTNTGASAYNINLRLVGDTVWSSFLVNGDTSRILQNRMPGDYEYYISESGGSRASCNDQFSVNCATDIVYVYNAFQAPELGRYGRVRVFGTQGGKRLYDIYLVDGMGDTTAALNVRQRNYTDLAAGTYQLYVQDDFGCAADSVGQFTINSLDTAWIPNLINAPNNSPNGFRPTWNSVPGVINYQLRVLNVTDGTLETFITGITDTMRAVTGLTTGKLYRFNVRSRYNNGTANVNSGYSNPVSRNLTLAGNKTDGNAWVEEASSIRIYPNPAREMLSIQAPAGTHISLVDMNGRVVMERNATQAEEVFHLNRLSSGVYLVQIVGEHINHVERVVKQ